MKSIKMNRFGIILIVVLSALLIFTCGKPAVEEEPVTEETTQPQVVEEDTTQTEQQEMVTPEVEEDTTEAMATQVEEDTTAAAETVTEDTLKQAPGQLEEVMEVVAEGDTIDMYYMVKPEDWLSKIAENEYGDIKMWKKIYKWNRKKIGDDPNLIFPFHEFLLKKLKENANDLEYEFYNYTVEFNESLWDIAQKEYGNAYAWIVLLRDNADVLGSDLKSIKPGTVLKVRTNLFNE